MDADENRALSLIKPMNELHGRIKRTCSESVQLAIELGKKLTVAKENVGHGNWLKYVETHLDFTDRTASEYMRAAKVYADLKSEDASDLDSIAGLLSSVKKPKSIPQPSTLVSYDDVKPDEPTANEPAKPDPPDEEDDGEDFREWLNDHVEDDEPEAIETEFDPPKQCKTCPTCRQQTLPEDWDKVPPSLEAVKAYCDERGNNVDPEAWVAFYESNGWKVGKNKMKSWRAAIVTWEKNRGKFESQTTDKFQSSADDQIDLENVL